MRVATVAAWARGPKLVTKLVAIGLLFFIPIGLLANLFIAQSMKDIRFAQAEVNGVNTLTALWPTFHAATSAAPLSPDEARPLLDAVGAVSAEPAFSPFATAIAAAAEQPADRRAFAERLRAAITTIGDRSNLILDPDLDSFYVMDAVTVKLPDLLMSAQQLALTVARLEGKASTNVDDRLAIAMEIAGLKSAADGLERSTAAAIEASADGSVGAALKQPLADLLAASDAVVEVAGREAAALAEGAPAPRLGAETAHAALLAATDGFFSTGSADLRRLLEARIGGFSANLWSNLVIVGVVTTLILILVGAVAFDISRCIDQVAARMQALADGDLDSPIPFGGFTNELGRLSASATVFRDALVRISRHAEERREQDRSAAALRAGDVNRLAGAFEEVIGGITRGVATSAGLLEAHAESLTRISRASSEETRSLSGHAEQATGAIQTSSVNASNLAIAIEGLVTECVQASEFAGRATGAAIDTRRKVDDLAAAADTVFEIVAMISEIAEQTNLLALNATIEASRAGSAGQGFAVVAAEVKNLADQTARATEQITARIEGIRTATGDVSGAIEAIRAMILDIEGRNTAIAETIQEQGRTVATIGSAVDGAVRSAEAVSRTVSRTARAATDSLAAASEVLEAARGLARQSETLNGEVHHFLRTVRTA